jgi:DNA-binding GntR family transcriptional regulator
MVAEEQLLGPSGALGQMRIRRSSTAEQAADVLRNLILHGEIGPGMPLREMQLAEAVGVSRNTMREALRILAREGIINQDRHHIATVVQLRAQDVRQIYQARRTLEEGAVRLVAEAQLKPELQSLRDDTDKLAAFRDDDPWMNVIDADRDFHVHLVQLANNPRLDALYAQLESEIRLCLAYTTRVEIGVEDIEKEHRTIVRRLAQENYDGTLRFLAGTLEAATARVCRVLERNEQQNSPTT